MTDIATRVSQVLADNITDTDVPHGQTLVEAQWEVQPFTDGPIVLLNGTIQDVIQQLKVINPSITNDPDTLPIRNSPFNGTTIKTPSGTCTCDNHKGGDLDTAIDEVHYLNGLTGQPRMGTGPRTCNRPSCEWDVGIYGCNFVSDLPGWCIPPTRRKTQKEYWNGEWKLTGRDFF